MTSSFKLKEKRLSSKYRIKTLTPFHIGSGEILEEKVDYRTEGEYIKIIHQDKLYERIMESENCIEIINNLRNYLLDNYKSNKNIDKIYSCKNIYFKDKIRNQTLVKLGKVFDSVKEDNQYYIPGSSIKGGFRTALLFSQYSNSNPYRLNQIQKKLSDYKNSKQNKKFKYSLFNAGITKLIEEHLGLKGVYFGDSNFIDYSYISVISVSKFFRDGQKYTKRVIKSNIMAINKDVNVELEISFDKHEKINYIFDKMNHYILSAVDREIELFKKTKSRDYSNNSHNKSLPDIIKGFEELKERVKSFIEDGNKRAIVRIGKEKGFHFNTIHSLMDIKTSKDIYKHMVRTPKEEAHPLLVSLIDSEDSYSGMLGWGEISKVGDEII